MVKRCVHLLTCSACMLPCVVFAANDDGETPPGKDAVQANVRDSAVRLRCHPAYAKVTPQATLRVWVEVGARARGAAELSVEWAVGGGKPRRQPLHLKVGEPGTLGRLIAIDLRPWKLKSGQNVQLTLVAGRRRSPPLRFEVAREEGVERLFQQRHVDQLAELKTLSAEAARLHRQLTSLQSAVTAETLDAKTAALITVIDMRAAALERRISRVFEECEILMQAMKDNRVQTAARHKRYESQGQVPLAEAYRKQLPALRRALTGLRAKSPRERRTAAVASLVPAAQIRTGLNKSLAFHRELAQFLETLRMLREILRDQEKKLPIPDKVPIRRP